MNKLKVIYEDNHLIAVNKRGGDLAQRDKTGDSSLLEHVKSYIKIKYNKPGEVFLGSFHRLDRPTSGTIIFARTSKGLSRMNELMKKNEIQKTYLALVDKRPSNISDTLVNHIRKDSSKNKSFVCKAKHPDAKVAKLDYEMIQEWEGKYLLRVNLYTGRHHQIRVQLNAIGCRIVGDLKYGYPLPNGDKSICLHCSEMAFIHPIQKKPIRITSKLPLIPEWALE